MKRNPVALMIDETFIEPRKPALSIRRPRNADVAMNPCVCKICGNVLDMLTYVHAASHGYADKYEMIRKGVVVPL